MDRTALRRIVQAVYAHDLPLTQAVDAVVTEDALPPDPLRDLRDLLYRTEITALLALAVTRQCKPWLVVHAIMQAGERRAEAQGQAASPSAQPAPPP